MFIEENIESCIEYLNTLQKLPNSGIIAGGSISNYLWSVKNNTEPIINDIDIYHLDYDRESKYKNKKKSEFYYRSDVEIKADSRNSDDMEYSHISITENANSYVRILNSNRTDLINNVEYQSNSNELKELIDTFDINNTQIAYDLKTGQCYYTKEFSEFINTGQLKVVNPNTPSHTILRILKKRDELGATVDLELTIEMLMNAYNCGDSSTRHYFGIEKYNNLYEKYRGELDKYFTENKYRSEKTKMLLTTLKPKNTVIFNKVPYLNRSLAKLKIYYNSIKGHVIKEMLYAKYGKFCNNVNYFDDIDIVTLHEYSDIISMNNWFSNNEVSSNIFNTEKFINSLEKLKWLRSELGENIDMLKYILNYKKDNIFEIVTSKQLQEVVTFVKIKYRKKISMSKQSLRKPVASDEFSLDDIF